MYVVDTCFDGESPQNYTKTTDVESLMQLNPTNDDASDVVQKGLHEILYAIPPMEKHFGGNPFPTKCAYAITIYKPCLEMMEMHLLCRPQPTKTWHLTKLDFACTSLSHITFSSRSGPAPHTAKLGHEVVNATRNYNVQMGNFFVKGLSQYPGLIERISTKFMFCEFMFCEARRRALVCLICFQCQLYFQ